MSYRLASSSQCTEDASLRPGGEAHLLPTIAEPHAHHLLLHAERVGQRCDLLTGGLGVLHEGLLERHAHARLDGGALLSTPTHGLCQPRAQGRAASAAAARQGRVRILQPLLQQRLQLAHVLEAQVQSLEARYRGLGEVVPVQLAHRQPDVALREPCTM